MTLTLVQKHPFKGSREFNLVDDEVHYTIKSPLKTESLSVVLNVLSPKPVISGSTLAFISQVNQEPLVELFLDKPDKESFDQFVKTMQQRITEEDFGYLRVSDTGPAVELERLSDTIDMLQKYVDPAEIESLLTALIELKAKPDDIKCLSDVAEAFNDLGFMQGQVLTYAPYINFLLSGQNTRGAPFASLGI